MWKCQFRGQGSDSRVIPICPLLSLKSDYVTVRYTNFRDCHYRTVIVIIYALTVRSYNELIKHLGIVGIVILRANNYTSITAPLLIGEHWPLTCLWARLLMEYLLQELRLFTIIWRSISLLLIIPSTTNTTVTVQESECRIAISFV